MVSLMLIEIKDGQKENIGKGAFKEMPPVGGKIGSYNENKEIRVYEVLEVHKGNEASEGLLIAHVKQLDSHDVSIHD